MAAEDVPNDENVGDFPYAGAGDCVSSEQEGLEARDSAIPRAGLGLFALRDFKKGEVLCEYNGTVLCTKDAIRVEDKSFLMRLGPQVYVDARAHPEVLARYINDCRNPGLYNVEFQKLPEERKALVLATRDICSGEELFVDYGRWYWLLKKPTRLGGAGQASASTAATSVCTNTK